MLLLGLWPCLFLVLAVRRIVRRLVRGELEFIADGVCAVPGCKMTGEVHIPAPSIDADRTRVSLVVRAREETLERDVVHEFEAVDRRGRRTVLRVSVDMPAEMPALDEEESGSAEWELVLETATPKKKLKCSFSLPVYRSRE